ELGLAAYTKTFVSTKSESASAFVIDHVAAQLFLLELCFWKLREVFEAKLGFVRDWLAILRRREPGQAVSPGLDALLDPIGNRLVLPPRGFLHVPGEVIFELYRQR